MTVTISLLGDEQQTFTLDDANLTDGWRYVWAVGKGGELQVTQVRGVEGTSTRQTRQPMAYGPAAWSLVSGDQA